METQVVLAIISPLENAYSETFIHFHRKTIDAKIKFLYGGALPNHSEDGEIANNIFNKIARRVFAFFNVGLSWQERMLKRYFLKHKVKAILAEYGVTGNALINISRQLNIPLIVHFHGYDAYEKEVLKSVNNYKRLFGAVSKVIVVSEHMKRQLERLGCASNKLVLNYYGPSNIFFAACNQYNKKRFAAVGRFVNKKAPQLTITAFEKVLSKHPDALLSMVGDGPLLQTCKNLVKEKSLEENVQFLNVLSASQIVDLFSNSIAFVQHSVTAENGDSEGTPVAVLEASASGLIVIATKHAGIPDIIIDGETGFLVDEKDVDGMADYMLKVLDDFSLAKTMGTKGRKRILENFTLDKHISIINKVIKEETEC